MPMLVAVATLNWSLWLQLVALGALLIVGTRAGLGRRYRETIDDLERAVEAKDRRIDGLEDDINGLSRRAKVAEQKAQECEKAIARWEARYEELNRYAARGAVEHFEQTMRAHSEQVAERHARMLDHLERLERTLGESQRSLGELILKDLEVGAKIAERLDVAVD